jgi:hypothetical protein
MAIIFFPFLGQGTLPTRSLEHTPEFRCLLPCSATQRRTSMGRWSYPSVFRNNDECAVVQRKETAEDGLTDS